MSNLTANQAKATIVAIGTEIRRLEAIYKHEMSLSLYSTTHAPKTKAKINDLKAAREELRKVA